MGQLSLVSNSYELAVIGCKLAYQHQHQQNDWEARSSLIDIRGLWVGPKALSFRTFTGTIIRPL